MFITISKNKETCFYRSRIMVALLLCSLFLSCSAQQSQKRDIPPFTKIQTSGVVNVYYTHSDTLALTVKGKAAELDRLSTTVENSVLTITSKGDFTEPVEVHISHNRLGTIESSGASAFKTTNEVIADSLSLNLSGSAHVKVRARVKAVKCVQSGASSVVLRGTGESLDANISGASMLKAFEFNTRRAAIVTTGAANARVFVSDRVVANAGGASDIRIKGNPTDVTSETSAAASISRVTEESAGKKRNDTTAYNWKSKKIIVIDKNDEEGKPAPRSVKGHSAKHWHGVSLGTNGYFNPGGGLNMAAPHRFMELNYGRSLNVQVNPFEKDFRIVKNYVRLVTGLGLDYHWYQFANNTNLNADSSFTWGSIDSSNVFSYKKNSLRTIYVQVPLLLEFNTSNRARKGFHLAFGVIGQYLIGSRVKQELERNRYEISQRRKDTYNLSPFGAKAHVNLGYRTLTVYAEYSLTQLFQAGRGPELYPFAAGIRIIPFS